MAYRLLLSVLVFVSFTKAFSSGLDTNATAKKTLLTNKLSSYVSFQQTDAKIDSFVKRWALAGASVAIVKDGKLVYAKGFGYAEKEKKVLATPSHTFRVASVSKLVTAIAIMKLVEEGKISINDTIFGKNGILDDARYTKTKDKRAFQITVKHLLIHEGGWNIRYGDPMFMHDYIAKTMGKKLPIDSKTIIEFSLRKGLHYTPGTASSYSNLGYCILGEVIEKVSGLTYEEYVSREILNPLGIKGMKITSNQYAMKSPMEVKYYDPGASRRTSVYGNNKTAPKTYEGTDFKSLSAAGGWTASASQLLKMLEAVDGHPFTEDILSCNAIDSMTMLSTPKKYGYGWIHADSLGNWWRTGTLCGSSAFMIRRCDGVSYAFITNTGTSRGNKFSYDIRKMMDEAIDTIQWWPSEDLFLIS